MMAYWRDGRKVGHVVMTETPYVIPLDADAMMQGNMVAAGSLAVRTNGTTTRVERETTSPTVDALDCLIALWTAEAMLDD